MEELYRFISMGFGSQLAVAVFERPPHSYKELLKLEIEPIGEISCVIKPLYLGFDTHHQHHLKLPLNFDNFRVILDV